MQDNIFSQDFLLERLEKIRTERGQSKAAFYGESGAGRSMPDNLKKKTYPSVEKIVALADYTGLSTDYLLGRTDSPMVVSSWDELYSSLDAMSESQLDSLVRKIRDLLSERQDQG